LDLAVNGFHGLVFDVLPQANGKMRQNSDFVVNNVISARKFGIFRKLMEAGYRPSSFSNSLNVALKFHDMILTLMLKELKPDEFGIFGSKIHEASALSSAEGVLAVISVAFSTNQFRVKGSNLISLFMKNAGRFSNEDAISIVQTLIDHGTELT
jgi:hypothetical protein